MPNTRIALAGGAVDGVNVKFYTPEPYVPGSTAYILDGKVYSQYLPRGISNPFGYFESNPDAGEIQVDFPPQPGDTVQIMFWDRRPTQEPVVDEVSAELRTTQTIIGTVIKPALTVMTAVIKDATDE